MQLIIPTPEQSEFVLRSLITVIGSALTETPRSLIAAAQTHLLNTHYDLDTLEPIAPHHLAEQISEPDLRRQVIQAMVVLMLSGGGVGAEQMGAIDEYARALQVDPQTLRNLRQLYQRRFLQLSLDVYRRCFITQKYQFEWRRQGIGWFLKGLINYLGWVEDRELVDRYRDLERLPEETLGYQFWAFCQTHQYAFPGEKGGTHENTCFHDVTHVLAGYDTSPAGELQVVAMTVGYKRDGDPLASLFFILLQQHLGIQVGLLSPANTGTLDAPNASDQFIQAFKRGVDMTVDLSGAWDHWAAFAQPVEQLRADYNIGRL